MCRTVKCAPIIRGCGLLKVLMALVLLGVAGWMLANPWTLNCNALGETCPGAAQEMLQTYHNDTNFNTAQYSAEIANYCDCITQCVNYITVYEKNKVDTSPTNCYTYSQQMGISLIPVNERRLSTRILEETWHVFEDVSEALRPQSQHDSRRLGDGGHSIPGMPLDTCTTCEGLETYQTTWLNAMAAGAAMSGVALLVTAGCESMELKWHSICYSIGVIVVDIIATTILAAGIVASGVMAIAALAACDPDAVKAPIEDAGTDSTAANSDAAAAFAYFLLKLIEPVVSGICNWRHALYIYHATCWLGMLCASVTFTASLCVIMHCTMDGYGDTADDYKTQHLHNLHASESEQMMMHG